MALQDLVNVAESCVPCDSGSGACRLHAVVRKSLPALHSVLGKLRVETLCHPEKEPLAVPDDPKAMTAPPACYAVMYPVLKEIAQKHGYCLAVHGTMKRDFDLLACPWTEDAGPPEPMIEEMKAAAEGVWTKHDWDDIGTTAGHSTEKPHGRRAWSIHLTNKGCYGPYLDVSVMPRRG